MEGPVEMNKNVCLICGYNELEERPYYSILQVVTKFVHVAVLSLE